MAGILENTVSHVADGYLRYPALDGLHFGYCNWLLGGWMALAYSDWERPGR